MPLHWFTGIENVAELTKHRQDLLSCLPHLQPRSSSSTFHVVTIRPGTMAVNCGPLESETKRRQDSLF